MSSSQMIDFRRSIPPHLPELHEHLASGLQALIAANDVGMLMRQSVARGAEVDRAAGAKFLKTRLGCWIDPSRIVLTNGTQNALLVLLQTLVRPDALVVAERLTYGSLRALATIAKVRIAGVDIDEHGIVPEAFEAICKARRPQVLYCNPTVQNPTTAIMPEARRLAIIDIARRYGVTLIEDDALGRLHPNAVKPIAALAPDITWYVMSATKCLAQGMRLAYVVTPSASGAERALSPIEHLSYWHVAPLTAALASHWINSGLADRISAGIARICAEREQLAREVLGEADLQSVPGSMHVWIRLPGRRDRHQLVAAAKEQGVLLRPAELFAIDDQPVPNAVRLALSPPVDLPEVRRGLQILRGLLQPAASGAARVAIS
jgi:DNA-binding transcriptional MocR family regulator